MMEVGIKTSVWSDANKGHSSHLIYEKKAEIVAIFDTKAKS